jgi:REP element-mobilizing transposase RayT
MVLAYHTVISAYGFWLPNDPRGSGSDFIRSWELFYQGRATMTHTPRSVAHDPHDRNLRANQKRALRYDPVSFSPEQIQAVGAGFAHAVRRSGFVIHACSILAEHAHLVIARHRYDIEQVVNQLKGEAAKELNRRHLHPFPDVFSPSTKQHSPWADDSWNVFLHSPADLFRAIAYVEDNPQKEHRAHQRWPFITPYHP